MDEMLLDPQTLFTRGTSIHFEYALSVYDEAVTLKSEQKKNPQELLKLDKWYQQELPKIVKRRGVEKFITHEELVLCLKWKLARGKWRPRLKELVQMNTPRVVMLESKKAFRQLCKRNNVISAVQALCKLKGVGPATASAVLTAAVPERLAFMADEVVEAVRGDESLSYTVSQYKNITDLLKKKVEYLNKETGDSTWTPHRLEMALWAHSIVADLNPELLKGMPSLTAVDESQLKELQASSNGTSTDSSSVEKDETSLDSNFSGEELSRDSNCSEEVSHDSNISEESGSNHTTNEEATSKSSRKSTEEENGSLEEPSTKKAKLES